MSFRLGLTGGIGMGKSTASGMFRELGHPVWDADAAVHRLYAPGGAAVAPVAAAFPGTLTDGGIDRARLRHYLDVVADKTGSGPGTRNDVGLLWPPGGGAPILVTSFLTATKAEPPARDAALASVAAQVVKQWS